MRKPLTKNEILQGVQNVWESAIQERILYTRKPDAEFNESQLEQITHYFDNELGGHQREYILYKERMKKYKEEENK